MNYQRHYDALIQKALNRSKPEGYTEKHHIVPRSLGGSDDPINLVVLTAREHAIAHLLLAHIHGGRMWTAVILMFNYGAIKSSRMVALVKEKHGDINKGKSHPNYGKKRSPESLVKFKQSMMGKIREDARIMLLKNNPMHNPEFAKKQGLQMLGNNNPRFKGFILATNIKSGDQIILCGKRDIESHGFSNGSVYKCVRKERIQHKGYTFERVSDIV